MRPLLKLGDKLGDAVGLCRYARGGARLPCSRADRFAKIAASVPGPTVPVIPTMMLPLQASHSQHSHTADLRDELGIPADATVFGRYGKRGGRRLPP